MKGKKIDNEFINSYINNCIKNNIFSSEEMLDLAKNKIKFIDEKIVEVEKLKLERNKLLDIVNLFGKNDKNISLKEIKLLSLYKIKNHNLCKIICTAISKNKKFDIDLSSPEIIFCIKQLLENEVLEKDSNFFKKGKMFDSYQKIILRI